MRDFNECETTKNFHSYKNLASLIYDEFFWLEKKCFGLEIFKFSILGESTNLKICEKNHHRIYFQVFLKNLK